MRLIKLFEVINELTQKVYYSRAGGPVKALYSSSKTQMPAFLFIANDSDSLKTANNITVIQVSTVKINKMYRDLSRKKYITHDFTSDDGLLWDAIERLGNLQVSSETVGNLASMLPIKVRELPNRQAAYKYVTTELGKAVGVYDILFGERPTMTEEDYIPFHNAKLFVPDNISKRGRDSAISVLETVYQKLEAANETTTFGGVIHFAKMASRIGGTYDVVHHDIRINPTISKSSQSVFSLLHEYGHKRMYEQMSLEQKKEAETMFGDLRRNGDSHMADLDYASAIQELIGQLAVGMPVTYVGRKRDMKKDSPYKIAGSDQYQGKFIVKVSHPENHSSRMIYPHNLLNPKKWNIPALGDQRPKPKEKWETQTDQWFPSPYSEGDWEEWWAELYAFYTHGNLSGKPAQWMKKMLVGGIGETEGLELTDSVGGNDGEITDEDPYPRPEPERGNEEGKPEWEWTDPYHSSGEENAVNSNTP